jgi:hypothetical protein
MEVMGQLMAVRRKWDIVGGVVEVDFKCACGPAPDESSQALASNYYLYLSIIGEKQ